jgi:hypothetical protein
MPLLGDYIQMSFFLAPSNWDSCYLKTLDVISFSNQISFENAKAIIHSPQNDISINV